jgi:hypothetical protein
MDTHDSRGPRDKSMALAWRRLTIGRQLLIAVNSALFIVAGVFLFLDYRIRFGRHLEEKRIARIILNRSSSKRFLGSPIALMIFFCRSFFPST